MLSAKATWVGCRIAGGRYRILALLGEGGMGLVYRAQDANLSTEVVVKVPRLGGAADAGFAARFAQEVRSLVHLSHPHVVHVIDVGEHDGFPFAVMQYLPGGSLDDRRPRDVEGRYQCVAPASLRLWLPQVAAALDFIHAQGYVHRDIKPSNILFDRHGHPFVGDFGVAKALSVSKDASRQKSLTSTGMVLGTPHYVSPEWVLGETLDGRSDQYALAVMVHELLAGAPPIDAVTPTAILVAQTKQAPPALHELMPALPRSLSEAVLRALAKDFRERFATCGDFAAAVLSQIGQSADNDLSTRTTHVRKGRISMADGAKVSCPACGAPIRLFDAARGKQARCKACNLPLLISADLQSVIELVPVASPDRSCETPATGSDLRGACPAVAASIDPQGVTPGNASAEDTWQTRAVSAEELATALGPAPRRKSSRRAKFTVAVILLMVIGATGWWYQQTGRPDLVEAAKPEVRSDGQTSEVPSQPDLPRLAVIADQTISISENLVLAARVSNAPPAGRDWRFSLAASAPGGMQIDASTGIVRWPVNPDRTAGRYPVVVTVGDAERDDLARTSFVVIITADPESAPSKPRPRTPPVVSIVKTEPAVPVASEPLTVYVAGEDAEGKPATVEYKLGGETDWKPVAKGTIVLSALAQGTCTLLVRATDQEGTVSQTQSKIIEVTAGRAALTLNEIKYRDRSYLDWFQQFCDNYRTYYLKDTDETELESSCEALQALVILARRHVQVVDHLLDEMDRRDPFLTGDPFGDFGVNGSAEELERLDKIDAGPISYCIAHLPANQADDGPLTDGSESKKVGRFLKCTRTTCSHLFSKTQVLSSFETHELLIDETIDPLPILGPRRALRVGQSRTPVVAKPKQDYYASHKGALDLSLLEVVGPTATDRLVYRLKNKDDSTVVKATLGLCAIDRLGQNEIMELLQHPSPRVRYALAWSINRRAPESRYVLDLRIPAGLQVAPKPLDMDQRSDTNTNAPYRLTTNRSLSRFGRLTQTDEVLLSREREGGIFRFDPDETVFRGFSDELQSVYFGPNKREKYSLNEVIVFGKHYDGFGESVLNRLLTDSDQNVRCAAAHGLAAAFSADDGKNISSVLVHHLNEHPGRILVLAGYLGTQASCLEDAFEPLIANGKLQETLNFYSRSDATKEFDSKGRFTESIEYRSDFGAIYWAGRIGGLRLLSESAGAASYPKALRIQLLTALLGYWETADQDLLIAKYFELGQLGQDSSSTKTTSTTNTKTGSPSSIRWDAVDILVSLFPKLPQERQRQLLENLTALCSSTEIGPATARLMALGSEARSTLPGLKSIREQSKNNAVLVFQLDRAIRSIEGTALPSK